MAKSQSKFYGLLALVAIVGLALIAYVATRENPALDTGGSTQGPSSLSGGAVGGELVSSEVGVSKGSPDASVVLEEYADFQCPYCGMVAALTMPTVMQRYVETGKVRVIFYDFPVHAGEKSFLAAEAARCAGEQDAFWPMHDILFQNMSEWTSKRDPKKLFRDYANSIGLDGGAVQSCVSSRKYRELVEQNRTRGLQHAVQSTPTFLINGRRITGAAGFDSLAEIIEEELAKST